MDEILKAVHGSLCEINVKGQDVFRMASAIQMLEQAIAMAEAEKNNEEPEATE